MNALDCFIREIIAHWSDLLLFAVGFVALLIYHLQNRSKTKEAAALVVLQIDDLENRIREIAGYISGDQINSVAYYESLPLMEEDYWRKYKHLFVRSIDSSSFTRIDRYYNYAIELRDQQMLLKQIQKDGFAATQTSLAMFPISMKACGERRHPSRLPIFRRLIHLEAGPLERICRHFESGMQTR